MIILLQLYCIITFYWEKNVVESKSDDSAVVSLPLAYVQPYWRWAYVKPRVPRNLELGGSVK